MSVDQTVEKPVRYVNPKFRVSEATEISDDEDIIK